MSIKLLLLRIINKIKGRSDMIPKKYIAGFLPRNPIIIDAGAHIGTDSIEMSNLWKHGTIHAFEPIPEIYSQLVTNTSSRKNIYTYRYALSNKTGNVDFFISSGESDASSSLLPPKEHINRHPNVLFNKIIKVNTITLDEWAYKNNITHVDFAWLDMQGFEFQTLKASRIIIKSIKVIFTEVNLVETYEGVTLYSEYKEWLESIGLKMVQEDFHWKEKIQGNVLFVRK
jgi:FkbM family methyltransferase